MSEQWAEAKAIETTYKGYRFRSRLEARWAVFFDQLGVRYQYEPQGFDLGGVPYLPDFWLPDLRLWVEVKGPRPTCGEEEKAERLAVHTRKSVYLLWGGIPERPDGWRDGWQDQAGFLWLYQCCTPGHHGPSQDACDGKGYAWWDNYYRWCECPSCGLVGVKFEARADRLPCACPKQGDRGHNGSSKRLTDAYDAARQARFEHGQEGARRTVIPRWGAPAGGDPPGGVGQWWER